MGEVYKARDTRLDRFVAIKVLPEHIAKREDLRARFEREARGRFDSNGEFSDSDGDHWIHRHRHHWLLRCGQLDEHGECLPNYGIEHHATGRCETDL